MNELYPSSFRDPVLARLKKRACRNADAIVVVSERTKQDLLRFYPFVDPGRVSVIYNGVGDEYYPEVVSEVFGVNGTQLRSREYFYMYKRGNFKGTVCIKFPRGGVEQGLKIPLIWWAADN